MSQSDATNTETTGQELPEDATQAIPGGPISVPMKTTERERLAYRNDRRVPKQRPMKTSKRERLAHLGHRAPKRSDSVKVVDCTRDERGAIVKAANLFRRQPTPGRLQHLTELIKGLEGRGVTTTKTRAEEYEARQAAIRRELQERADREAAEKARREEVLSGEREG